MGLKVIALNEYGRRIGGSHHRSKLSDELVDEIRSAHEDRGKSYGQIAMRYGLPKSTVQMVCTYQRRVYTAERYIRVNFR